MTWVELPARNNKGKEQDGKDIKFHQCQTGLNTLATSIWAMTTTLVKNKNPRFLQVPDFKSDSEVLLVCVTPSLCHCKDFHCYRNHKSLHQAVMSTSYGCSMRRKIGVSLYVVLFINF